MIKLLALDISTSSGWAYFEDKVLVEYGPAALDHTVREYGSYPWNFIQATKDMAERLMEIVYRFKPDVIVIEETNMGRQRYSQKVLEMIHGFFLSMLSHASAIKANVIYVSSSTWRKAIGMEMSSADRRNNSALSRAKSKAKSKGEALDKAKLGIRGKVTKKHLAVRYVNETYNLQLKIGQNDQADAIALGTGYLLGAAPCDGT